MRKKNTVLILGIASILILISVQVYIIVGVWKQKNEMFTLRYSQLSQEASGYIWRASQNGVIDDQGFDMVRMLLNDSTDKMIDSLCMITDQNVLKQKKKGILEYYNAVIQREQVLSKHLSSYFEMRGFEKNFMHKIYINNLELINQDTIIIYRSDKFQPRRSGTRRERTTAKEQDQPLKIKAGSEIFVGSHQIGGNHFRLFLDYYIDFSDKKKIILKETSATLGLSTFSILLVGIMFIITYRNLTEERGFQILKPIS